MHPAARTALNRLALILSIGAGLSVFAQEPPAVVALAIDTSGSIRTEVLDQIKQLAGGVLEALPPGSQVAVLSFNDRSTVILDRTSDTAAVQQALQGLQRGLSSVSPRWRLKP